MARSKKVKTRRVVDGQPPLAKGIESKTKVELSDIKKRYEMIDGSLLGVSMSLLIEGVPIIFMAPSSDGLDVVCDKCNLTYDKQYEMSVLHDTANKKIHDLPKRADTGGWVFPSKETLDAYIRKVIHDGSFDANPPSPVCVTKFSIGIRTGKHEFGMMHGPVEDVWDMLKVVPDTDNGTAFIFQLDGTNDNTPVYRWSDNKEDWVRMNSQIIVEDEIPF